MLVIVGLRCLDQVEQLDRRFGVDPIFLDNDGLARGEVDRAVDVDPIATAVARQGRAAARHASSSNQRRGTDGPDGRRP